MKIRFDRFPWHVMALVLSMLVLPTASLAARVGPMDTMQPRTHYAKKGVSLDAISKAVIAGAHRNHWQTQVRAPGSVLAELSTGGGKHRVTVAIDFDLTTFVIRYHASHNLGYVENYCPRRRAFGNSRHRRPRSSCDGPGIHPYYNDWLRALQDSIAEQIATLAPDDARPALSSPLIADEIRKLKELHDEGVLSDAEYEQQKQKLLAR